MVQIWEFPHGPRDFSKLLIHKGDIFRGFWGPQGVIEGIAITRLVHGGQKQGGDNEGGGEQGDDNQNRPQQILF